MTRPVLRAAAGGALGVVLLAGCGGSHPIPGPQAKALQQLVREIRSAAAAGNADRFHNFLDQLERTVNNYEAAGKLTHQQAQNILDAASQVNADGVPSQSPSPTPSTESPTPTPTPTTESPTPTPTFTTPSPTYSPPPPTETPPPPVQPTTTITIGAGGSPSDSASPPPSS